MFFFFFNIFIFNIFFFCLMYLKKMMKIKTFYFLRQKFLFYYVRKLFFIIIYKSKRFNILWFLFWLHFYIYNILKYNYKFLVNYRYSIRNLPYIENNSKKLVFFYLLNYKTIKFIYYINGILYYNFYYINFLYYYYYLDFYIKDILFLNNDYMSLQNYFFNNFKYRYNYFELFWIIFSIVPSYLTRFNQKRFGLKKCEKWKIISKINKYSYLFKMSLSVKDYFNINKNNAYLFLTKQFTIENNIKKKKKNWKIYNNYIKLLKKKIYKKFIKKVQSFNLMRLKFRRFGWYFRKYRYKLKFRKLRQLRSLYINSRHFKYFRFKYLQKKYYKRKRRYNIIKLFSRNFKKKSLRLLEKKQRLILNINFKYIVLKKVLIYLSTSTIITSVNQIASQVSFFFNFKLIYAIFSEGSFLKNMLYMTRLKRFYILFNYLKNQSLKKHINNSLYNFMTKSNVIYSFFIPPICKNLLLKIYKKKKSASFNWIFYIQLGNLFYSLFSSNFLLNLSFTDSESLNSLFLNSLFEKFLSFNPPKSKFHFLKEICDIYILTGITKDSNLLHKWIIKNLSIIFFRKHWQFLSFLKMTLIDIFSILENEFGIKGIFITFRGKIGQVGSVRKKTYFLHQGVYNFSNLALKTSFNSAITKTDTGAIGVSVFLFY